ncbi:hypothetical protein [Mycoplasma todarodis]|uniref:Uncharacterized protein n=1 Tax=Mycoplasma todarodis TaxID=1937191 RepID=A0A4R0XMM3_9MOLU|nr:hypothetical protein [Mycoplasma todarodis]TCG11973.1 hypothetical protein C4B25_00515 [Mycoplasma todarodis]
MLETLKAKHKLNKWFYFIPIIGTIIYSVMFEFALNTIIFDGKKQFKIVKKYKSIFGLISFLIAIAFLATFFSLRNKHGYGAYPWFFWVGLGFGLSQNLAPIIPWFLYKKGIESFENKHPDGIVTIKTDDSEEGKIIKEIKIVKEIEIREEVEIKKEKIEQ